MLIHKSIAVERAATVNRPKNTKYFDAIRKIGYSLIILIVFTGYVHGQPKLSPGDHFAQINGNKIHYFISGHGPVCLTPAPGWGIGSDYMRTLKPFEKHLTMVYYDTRMSGQSTGPDDAAKYTGQDLLEDMDSLRVYLGQSKVWLTGHSGGGFQVLNYGIYHSDHLYGIISLDAQAVHDSLSTAGMMNTIDKRKGAPYYAAAKNAFLGTDSIKRTAEQFLVIIFPLYFHDTEKTARFPKNLPVNGRTMGYAEKSRMFAKNLLPDLYKITVPVLIYVGDDDFICGESQSRRIHQNIPSSELVIIRDAGHFPWIEQPEQFYQAFERWIKKYI